MEKEQTQSFYIKKLYLNNFKKFKNVEIQFGKGFNFLIGSNNAGKSTILEALDIVIGSKWLSEETMDSSFFLDGEKDFMICAEIKFPKIGGKDNENRINIIRNLKLSKGSNRAIINGSYTNTKIEDILNGAEIADELFDVVGENNGSISRVHFVLAVKAEEDGSYVMENYMWLDFEKPIQKGKYGKELESYRSVKIYINRQARNDLISFLFIPAARSENKQLFQIAPYTWLGKYLKNLQKEQVDALEDFSNFNQDNLFPIQPDKSVMEFMNALFENKSKVSINSFDHKHVDTLFKYAHIFLEDPFFAEIEKKGHGMQSAVAMALFSGLIEQEAKKHPGYSTKKDGVAENHWATILEIEEPESHFHPPIRSKLISLLKEKFIDLGAQVILSTHDENFVKWPSVNGSNFIFPLSVESNKICSFEFQEANYEGDVNSRILRFQSHTVFSDKVLIVEGCEAVSLDCVFMRLFEKNLNCNSIAIAQSVDIKPRTNAGDGGNLNAGGGASQIPDIVKLYKKLNINRACLIDIDCLFNGSIKVIITAFNGNYEEFNFTDILSKDEIEKENGGIISAQEMREKIRNNEIKEKLYLKTVAKLSGLGIFIYDKGDFEGNFKQDFVEKFTKDGKVIKEALTYAIKNEAELNDDFENNCLVDGAKEDFEKIIENCINYFNFEK